MVSTKRRKNTFTRFLEDIIDDSKDLVDDLIDRAKDVEEHGRDVVKDVVDDDEDDVDVDPTELRQLKASLEALTAKVTQLADIQAKNA